MGSKSNVFRNGHLTLLIPALLAFPVIALTHALSRLNADDVVPGLISVEHWTPFYWAEARFGSLSSLLSLPFRNLHSNLLVLTFIHTFLFLLFLVAIPQTFLRNFSFSKYLIYIISAFSLFVTNIYWTRDFTGPAFPYGTSFGLAIIPLVLSLNRDKYFMPITVLFGLLAAWVNPLITLQFLPIYVSYFLFNRKRIRQLVVVVIVDSFSSSLFIAYGILHGAIRGFSLPSFKEFTYNNWYLPLVISQGIALVLITYKYLKRKLVITEVQIFLATLLAWPSVLTISTLNHVKANQYYPRYFIPVVAVGVVVQIFGIVYFSTTTRKPWLVTKILSNSRANLVVKLVIVTILIAVNFPALAVTLRTSAVSEPYLHTDIAALKMLENPEFIAGDYWYSWPMKLFLRHPSEVPVLTYRKEGQKIFQKEHSIELSSALKNGAAGLCFGPVSGCATQISAVAALVTNRPFASLAPQVLRKEVIDGVDVSVIKILRTDALNRCWSGAQLPTEIGKSSSKGLFVEAGKVGFASYGPYVRLKPGRYKYSLEFSTDRSLSPGTSDIANNAKQIVGPTSIQGTEGKRLSINQTFVQQTLGLSEFRVNSNGKLNISIYSLCLSAAK